MEITRSGAEPSRELTEFGSRNGRVAFIALDAATSVVRITLGHHGVLGLHAGSRDQIFCLVSGSGTVRCGAVEAKVAEGDVIRWSAGEEHETSTEEGLVALVFQAAELPPLAAAVP